MASAPIRADFAPDGWGIGLVRTFEVEVAGEYELELAAGVPALARIEACGGCRWLGAGVPVLAGETTRRWLDRGQHKVSITAFTKEPEAAVALSIAPTP